MGYLNLLNTSVALMQKPNCCANQLTGFYMRATLTLKGLSTSDLKMKRAPLNKRLDIILTYMQYAYMYIAYVLYIKYLYALHV